jgi:hypothetical protein
VVYFLDAVTVTTHLVKGFRTDRNGNLLWGGMIKDVSSVASGKGRLAGVMTANGNSILVWADSRLDGNGVYAQELNLDGELGVVTGVAAEPMNAPMEFALYQNYPNPFNPTTNLKFDIAHGNSVTLKIFDLLGREVLMPVNQYLDPGSYRVTVNLGGMASGTYFYRLTAGDFVSTKKMILVR